ncbi:MAG: DUF29 domain-containing protein [Stellaceae bacterium]
MSNQTLYDEDFVAWSQQQVGALRVAARNGSNQLLDWENLAEEIEGLGISQKSALGSQIKRIIHHLLKLQHSPARNPQRGWENSIIVARDEIEDLLERSPSLRREIGAEIARQGPRAARLAVRDLGKRAEADPAIVARIRTTTYSEDQIVGDWFPPEPGAE